MRLFLALEVPAHVRQAVDRAVRPVRERHPKLRWTRPRAWHLTLAFLGEVGDEVAAGLPGAVAPVAAGVAGPIELSLADAGRFGKQVLWLGVDDAPSGAVARLGEGLRREAAAAGAEVDTKPVHPHLTLARGRRKGPRVTRALVEACPVVEATWEVERVVLYRSRLGRGPARYEELASLPFGASPPEPSSPELSPDSSSGSSGSPAS